MILSAYADDIVVFIKDQRDADLLINIVEVFSRTSAARVNWKKSEALAVGEWRDGLPVLPQNLVWRKDGFKYLGIHLGQENVVQRNWEGVTEKIEGKLSKWKWLLPQMSFKGRVLVLNNLIASQLWHRLTCLDPPSGFLAHIQRRMVDFFWEGLHWVPQGVLFLAREEGGQGLVHLASRTATFRLQFIKKYLTSPEGLVWRDVASCILRSANNLGLDTALFLIDFSVLKLSGLPPFYQGVFKSWALFTRKRCPQSNSLYWLLREPLIYRAKLDVSSSTTPGLTGALLRSGALCLQQLVNAVGPTLSDAPALGSLLGLQSVRVARRLLELWRQRLTWKERSLLRNYSQGEVEPDPADPFPEISLSPGLGELTGPLLATTRPEDLTLHKADKKTLYFNCVKVLNRSGLCNRRPTVWSERLGQNGPGPQWRILYKPPLKKRTADLQWRILHGAVASNAFISILNPAVLSQCPFYDLRETIYHVFTECKRLASLFSLLTLVFSLFNVVFTEKVFIMGAAYKKVEKEKWQLLNYLSGEAKMAIYLSRKARVENGEGQEARAVWLCNVRARLWLEFRFYRHIGDLDAFKQRWCFDGIVCSIVEEDLVFAQVFIR